MLAILDERSFRPTRSSPSRRAAARAAGLFRDRVLTAKALDNLRLLRRRHLPDVGGRRDLEGVVAEIAAQAPSSSITRRRGATTRTSPRRARGQTPRRCGASQEEHHCQPELLDGAARCGAQAPARPAVIKRVVVATYQSVSGAGKDGHGRARPQTKALYSLQDVQQKKFTKRIAFNVIPHIDVFMEDGYTKEEWKMMVETKKILDPKIKLTATCVRVPGCHRPLRGGERRVREPDHGRRGAVDPARAPRHRRDR
jgi:hypothetical protein